MIPSVKKIPKGNAQHCNCHSSNDLLQQYKKTQVLINSVAFTEESKIQWQLYNEDQLFRKTEENIILKMNQDDLYLNIWWTEICTTQQ